MLHRFGHRAHVVSEVQKGTLPVGTPKCCATIGTFTTLRELAVSHIESHAVRLLVGAARDADVKVIGMGVGWGWILIKYKL